MAWACCQDARPPHAKDFPVWVAPTDPTAGRTSKELDGGMSSVETYKQFVSLRKNGTRQPYPEKDGVPLTKDYRMIQASRSMQSNLSNRTR